jgi:hypothetical protein
MSDRPETPAWAMIATRLSSTGVVLIELSGNIIGCRQCDKVPGDIYRDAARQAIASALVALDYLDRAEQDPTLLQLPPAGEI